MSKKPFLLALVATTFGASGCVNPHGLDPRRLYLHDPGRAEQSKEAKEAFDKYRAGSTTVFDEMLSNLERTDESWDEASRILAGLEADAFVQALGTMTWATILGGGGPLTAARVELERVRGEAEASVVALTARLAEQKSALSSASEAVAALKADQKALEKRQEEYQGQIDLLREGIAAVARGKPPSDPAEIDKQMSALGGVVDPPGLKLTILGLALDLAEGERDRAAAEIAFSKRAIQNAEAQLALAEDHRINEAMLAPLLRVQGFELGGGAYQAKDVTTTIVEILEAYRTAPNVGDRLEQLSRLQTVLQVLNRVAVVSSVFIPRARAQTIEAESLAHQLSISRSKIAAGMREDIIARGLEGLALYHAGGIKPEQVAEFVYAAGVIAALSL